MATIGSEGDVTVRVGTTYDDKGTDAAEKDVTASTRKLEQKWKVLEEAQKKLGITTQQEKIKMVQAYKTLKTSGVASTEELRQAQIRLDQTLGKGPSLIQRLKSNWLGMLAAVTGAILLFKKAWDLAGEAAQFKQQRAAFSNLAASHNADSDKIIAGLKRVSVGMINTANLMKAAGTAMLLGIPANKLSKMMEIARASSRITGQTIAKSFQDIGTGIGRQSPLILDNLGIVVKLTDAYKAHALQLKKNVSQLTDTEKKQAFVNATMKAGEEIVKRVGVQGATSAEKMAMLTARMDDLKIVIGALVVGPLLRMAELLGLINDIEKKTELETLNARIGLLQRSTEELREQGRFKLTLQKQEEKLNQLLAIRTELIEAAKKAEAVKPVIKPEVIPPAEVADAEEAEQFGPSLQGFHDFIRAKLEANQAFIDETQAMAEQAMLTEEERELLRHERKMEQLNADLLMLQEAEFIKDEQALEFMVAREQAEMLHQQKLNAIRTKEAKKQAALETKKEKLIFNMKLQIGRQLVGLMRALGGEHKIITLASIAFETVANIIRTKQNTAVAIMKAKALDPLGPTAARVAALGAIQLGIIGASAAVQAFGALSGGGGGEEGSSFGASTPAQETNVFNAPAEQQQPQIIERTVINIEGNVIDQAQFARDLIPFTREAEDDKVL